jgi:hypothetical protein
MVNSPRIVDAGGDEVERGALAFGGHGGTFKESFSVLERFWHYTKIAMLEGFD